MSKEDSGETLILSGIAIAALSVIYLWWLLSEPTEVISNNIIIVPIVFLFGVFVTGLGIWQMLKNDGC